jgi:hypothetical protein
MSSILLKPVLLVTGLGNATVSEMPDPPYTLEFYEDESGEQPARRWMKESLTPTQRRAIGVALHEILAYEGTSVCSTEFGKPLGDGLFEFRLRHDAEEILPRKGRLKKIIDRARGKSERILLRVFFHPHGDKLILLLGGYDKGRHPSSKRQETEIATARQRLEQWRRSREG